MVDSLADGAVIGDYRIVRLLGEGGMGFVYEANHEVLNRRAAIKLLRPELTTHYSVVSRFLQEAKAVNVVNHDHIVDIYDYGERPDGSVYFVMEYLEGENLGVLLHREGQLPLAMTCSIFSQILGALAAAHAKQIVHRDLKPDNVFLIKRQDNPTFVKLLDFGIAKLRGEGAVGAQTGAGTIMGTPQYMSPEQAQAKVVDARSDLYALGVMLYQAASGVLPYESEMVTALLSKIVSSDPPSPRRVAKRPEELPRQLEVVIQKAMTKSPAGRYQSAEEMQAALAGIAADYAPVPQAGAVEPVHAVASPRTGKLLAVGGMCAAVAIALVVFLGRGGGGETGKKEATVPDSVAESGPTTLATMVARGDLAGAKSTARERLIGQLESEDGEATAISLAAMRAPRLAPLLYKALDGTPQSRIAATGALCKLKLPEAAPKIRAALEASGGAVKTRLAACVVELGDASAVPLLVSALDGAPLEKLDAAEALSRTTERSANQARKVLAETLAANPAGSLLWRRAAVAQATSADQQAIALLATELAAAEPDRALFAAEALSELGDKRGIGYLERVLDDPDFPLRGEAALALAAAGNDRALAFVGPALAAADASDQRRAVVVAAAFAEKSVIHLPRIAALADDPNTDSSVKTAALIALLAF